MHRDIKPSNILMDKQCGIHLIDFGLARRIAPSKDYHSEQFFQPITVSETNPMIIQSNALPRLDSDTTLPTLNPPQRQLTRHVATRWYRPPEVITLQVSPAVFPHFQHHYDYAVDIWSIGCIFVPIPAGFDLGGASADAGAGDREAEAAVPRAELLSAERARGPRGREEIARGIREQVAPAGQDLRDYRESHGVGNRGNVETREEIRELSDPAMRRFLEELEPIQGKGFRELLPHADDAAIELLTEMLQFGSREEKR